MAQLQVREPHAASPVCGVQLLLHSELLDGVGLTPARTAPLLPQGLSHRLAHRVAKLVRQATEAGEDTKEAGSCFPHAHEAAGGSCLPHAEGGGTRFLQASGGGGGRGMPGAHRLGIAGGSRQWVR